LVLLLSLAACSGIGVDSSSTTGSATPSTSTTEPDGSLDCLTTVSFISIPEYPTDLIGEPTPLAAAERYAAFEGRTEPLTEVGPLQFAIVDQGRETVIVEVFEAPAGGYLGGPIRGCAR
jgi:hypothetical protein